MTLRWTQGLVAMAAAGALAGALAAARPPSAGAATGGGATITVQGNGQVVLTDLKASFQVGVQETAPTASGAMNADNTKMQRVIAALEKAGAAATALSTTNLSLQPNYQNMPDGSTGQISGFTADDTLNVNVPTLAQTGSLIDAALAAGANNLDGVNFAPANQSAADAAALAAAVRDAEVKAQAMAQASHLTLGPVTSITTVTQEPGPLYSTVMAAAAPSAATPVLSGQQYESAQATVTFSASN